MNKIVKGAGALLLLVVLTACSTRAPSDSIILYYKAGAGDDRQFGECIKPGTNGSYPMDDEIFALPTSMRTWNIRPKGGDTADPIASGTLPQTVNGTSQPGPEVVIYATADFYLNSDCAAGAKSPIVKFWESTGRRYGISADGEEGFNQGNFSGQPIYEEIKKKGPCPPVRITITDVNFRDPKIAAARANAYAAEQDANAKRIAAQGEADRAAILEGVGNSPGYVRLQEIEAEKEAARACQASKNCTVIIGQPNTTLPVGGR